MKPFDGYVTVGWRYFEVLNGLHLVAEVRYFITLRKERRLKVAEDSFLKAEVKPERDRSTERNSKIHCVFRPVSMTLVHLKKYLLPSWECHTNSSRAWATKYNYLRLCTYRNIFEFLSTFLNLAVRFLNRACRLFMLYYFSK